jgi:rubredoxin
MEEPNIAWQSLPFEFICKDCKSHVYSYGGDPEATRCHMCGVIHDLKLDKEKERQMRETLGCEILEDEDSAKLGE